MVLVSISFNRALLLSLLTLLCTTCSGQCKKTVTRPKVAAKESVKTCTSVGAFACKAPPLQKLDRDSACNQLSFCLRGKKSGDENTGQVTIVNAQSCKVVAKDVTVALVGFSIRTADDDPHMPSAHGVAIFLKSPRGWCAVDHVLPPTWPVRSYCETATQINWNSRSQLVVRAKRVCHEALDQEEIAAGESDVTTRECEEIHYKVAANRLVELRRQDILGDDKCAGI